MLSSAQCSHWELKMAFVEQDHENCDKQENIKMSFFVYSGLGGLDPLVVAHAILCGIKTTTSSSSLHFVTNIRLVLNKINVFLTFNHQTTQMFQHAVIDRGNEQSHLDPLLYGCL